MLSAAALLLVPRPSSLARRPSSVVPRLRPRSTVHAGWVFCSATPMALIYDTRIITLDPAVWTGKEAAPSPWQSLAASTQRHGTRSFSKTMPDELGVQNRSRGAYLTTRQTHCGCMARPSAGADTLACCSHSGSLGHALPVAEYTAVVQYSTMIAVQSTRIRICIRRLYFCMHPHELQSYLLRSEIKYVHVVQASTSDGRLRVHQVCCGDTVLFVNSIIPGRWKARGTCMQPGACSDVQHLPPRVINNGRRTRAVYLEKVVCYLSGVPVSTPWTLQS
jgi:hypothetical protein